MNTANSSIPMNVSDAPLKRIRKKGTAAARARGSTVRIVIRREDHIGDGLGFIFLEADADDHDAIIERLREYLGPRIRILKAEIGVERIEVEAGGRRFAEEAARLAEAAEGLRRKGASRNAMAHFKEALALDPLNVMALCAAGCAVARRARITRRRSRMLCKAREAGGDSAEVLHELGRVAAGMGRIATAIVYLERGLRTGAGQPGDPANAGGPGAQAARDGEAQGTRGAKPARSRKRPVTFFRHPERASRESKDPNLSERTSRDSRETIGPSTADPLGITDKRIRAAPLPVACSVVLVHGANATIVPL